jgi:glutaminyl-peptide cyclotransferase
VQGIRRPTWVCLAALVAFWWVACGHDAARPKETASVASSSATASVAVPPPPPQVSGAESAPPASQTGGFDGAKAYEFTAKVVGFGPRPPDSDAIRATQRYIHEQLQSFGCMVDEDEFHSSTPIGDLAMKNIIAKVPGQGKGIILLLTHYDTLRLDKFVGAVDGGSSTGLMLEMARLFCAGKRQSNAVWIAFLDGEEAQVVKGGVAQWTSTDSEYGSRELAARLAISGDLKRVHAVVLADMTGPKELHLMREENSTKWLADLVWKTAARLGYVDNFVSDTTAPISDDHEPFLHRGVAGVDVIDLNDYPYWHTTEDTMDKVSPRSLAIAGHVILETVNELQKKFR